MINIPKCKNLIEYLLLLKRFYGKNTTIPVKMKRIHQEIMRYVHPSAQINISSDINVQVKPVNLFDYPDGNAFIAELHGGDVNNTTTSMTVNVSTDDKVVEVFLKNIVPYSEFHCELAIPISAAVNIQSKAGATIQHFFGNKLIVSAIDYIRTEKIRSESIKLQALSGSITCCGLLLAKHTNIETKENGNIILEKVLGDELKCKTVHGNITSNCSYVDKSKFETDFGCLILKNIHKNTKVLIHKTGELSMTGVNGNIHVKSNGGSINLQLSELRGDNCIETSNMQSAAINISNSVEQNINVMVDAIGDSNIVILDNTLAHLSGGLTADKKHLRIAAKKPNGQLQILCKDSSLTMAKSSWQDSMREQILSSQTT